MTEFLVDTLSVTLGVVLGGMLLTVLDAWLSDDEDDNYDNWG